IKNPDLFWQKITSSADWNIIATQVNVIDINNQLHFLDSLKNNNPEANELFKNKPIIVSLHTTKATDFDALYVISMPRFKQESFINEIVHALLGEKMKLNKRIYNGVSIREFNYNNKYFAYTVYSGLFIGSHTSILVEDAIRQLKTRTNIKSDKNFRRVYDSAGKNVDGHIYVNYTQLARFASVYTTASNDVSIKRVRNFAGWTQLDLSIKKESVLMNGFTIVTDTAQYLYTLQDQKPLAPTVFEILPRRTALFQLISVSDKELYFKNLNAHLRNTGETQKYVLNSAARSQLSSWIGSEICYFITEASSVNFNNNVFAAIKASDLALARKTLKDYGEKSAAGGFREELYRGKIIGYINESDIVPALLGPKFERITRFFYTYIEDYVIIGNQASSIRSIIDDNLSGRNLSSEESFMQFQKKLSGESNFYSFINISRSSYIIKSYATNNYFDGYEKNQSYLNKINSIAYQISGNGKLFYTTLSFDVGQALETGEINLLWASQLDTSVSMQPQMVINHNTNMLEIVVQDDANNLYLLDNGGDILWKRQINEKILSPVFQVDLFKNGKLQLVFNTATRLFLIDRNRNNVGNFPIKLPAEASTAMSLFDYNSNRDYRIFIPCDNGQVYSYLAGGSPSAAWIFNKPIGKVLNPVQHFVIDGKDYLVISTDDGKFYMLDRRGAVRAEAKLSIYRPANSEIYLEKDENNRSYFVTTDTTGTIFSIFPDGNVYSKTVVPFSPNHYFIFQDINSDQVKDYIFLDNNGVAVFNKDNSGIFNHSFNQGVIGKARFYPFSTGKGKIGTASIGANEIYLLSDDGSMYDGFPLKGSTPFIIADLNKDGSRKIITGSVDGNIYVYNFE
ncbi:MAG: hypothetical protein ACR2GN_07830, partial [Bacteroidia bacterium]